MKPDNKFKVKPLKACLLCFTAGKVLMVHRKRALILSYSILVPCPRCKGRGFI